MRLYGAPQLPDRCPECGLFGHDPFCSLQTLEYKAAQVEVYYNAWVQGQQSSKKLWDHNTKQIRELQGRCAILRNENNKLRRKLYPGK